MNEKLTKNREQLVAKVIEAIKSGTAPWQRPWNANGAPKNAITGRQYTGINQISLMMYGLEIDGGKDPRWITFLQAKEKCWRIKKGSSGFPIELWSPAVKKSEGPDGEEVEETYTLHKVFTVFHATQVEGIGEFKPDKVNIIEANDKAEKLIKSSGADIHCGGYQAFFDVIHDYIQLPLKQDFKSVEGYYSTALHELTHWTGHKERLNREQTASKFSPSYAYEELIAEMGSLFLTNAVGIPRTEGEFQNHTNYINSWCSELSANPDKLFKAAAEANKAANYLLNKAEC